MKIQKIRTSEGEVRYCELLDGGEQMLLKGNLYSGLERTSQKIEAYDILAPVEPPAIFCIGLNYRRHAEEGGMPIPEKPVVFLKTPNTIQNPGEPIVLPKVAKSEKVDYEAELAVVIGKSCLNVPVEEAFDYVLGYTCANDVSARDWQLDWGGGQWCRGKCFDTFCPLGPTLVTPSSIPDPNALSIRSKVNGVTKQDWVTGDMIFNVSEIISFLSQDTTIHPGSVILTGTPHGVGMAQSPPLWLKDGDLVEVEIEGIGNLISPVLGSSSS